MIMIIGKAIVSSIASAFLMLCYFAYLLMAAKTSSADVRQTWVIWGIVWAIIYFASLFFVSGEGNPPTMVDNTDWEAKSKEYLKAAENCERIANRPDLQGLPNTVNMLAECRTDAKYWRQQAKIASIRAANKHLYSRPDYEQIISDLAKE